MLERLLIVSVLILNCSALLAAETYRWEDADGNIYYGDALPPPDALNVTTTDINRSAPAQSLPYALLMAVREAPVTLYIASVECGEPCDIARNFLVERGVPHTLLDASKPGIQEALKALPNGRLEVPTAKVGAFVLWGFNEERWNAALDVAGYPKEAMISVSSEISEDDGVDPTADTEDEGEDYFDDDDEDADIEGEYGDEQ